MPGLSLLSGKGSKLQLEMARGRCAISTAAVLMDEVRQLPKERACLLLAQAVGLDNLSKLPSGYIFYGLHFHAVSFSLFRCYVMAMNPGALSLKTVCSQCLSDRRTLQHFPHWSNACKPCNIRCSHYTSKISSSISRSQLALHKDHVWRINHADDKVFRVFFWADTISTFS